MIQTVLAVAGVVLLLAVLWAAREALMLVYVSALHAMALSPLVKWIERPRRDNGRSRIPRWLAILSIYAVLSAVMVMAGLMVIPPLVGEGEALWAKLPSEFNRLQTFLIRHRIMTH